jgi:hypothetical protein
MADPQIAPTQTVEKQEKPLGERPPKSGEHPTTVWICENPQCAFQGRRQKVPWQHLGGSLYLVGTVRCHCGSLPVREPRGRR